MLHIIDYIPDGLLESDAKDLHQILDGPTLIHLQGQRQPAVFVSALLHGNEPAGLHAVQAILKKYQGKTLPRDLSIFIGNVSAAKQGMRHLPGQHDYNRVWMPGNSAEHEMTEIIINEMRERGVFVSVDCHNNTGLNPHYGCVNKIDHRFLHLASMFTRTVVYFIRPQGVQSMAFAQLCPAVTLECGKIGDPVGLQEAVNLIDGCMHMHDLPEGPVHPQDIDLFHTVAIIKVPPEFSFAFESEEVDIRFPGSLDHMNFRELPVDTLFAQVREKASARLEAWDEQGNEVSERFFKIENGELRTRQAVMPSMLTLDEEVIRQDCLCYFMERMQGIG